MEGNNKKKNKNYYKYHNNHGKNNKNNKNYYKYYYKKRKQKKQNYNVENSVKENKVEKNILLNKEQIKEEKVEQNIKEPVYSSQQVVQQVLQTNDDYEELEFVPIKKVDSRKYKKFGFLKYALGFALLVVIIFSASYSFFTYTKDDSRQADITSGEVYVRISGESVNMTLNKMYPRTSEEARARNDNYIDFTVKAKNTSPTKIINYVLNITNGENIQGKTRINPQYLILDLQEKVNNEYTCLKNAIPLSSFSFSDVIANNVENEITKEYRLRMWVSDEIVISDTENDATYTQEEFANLFANVHIEINSQDSPPTPTPEPVEP